MQQLKYLETSIGTNTVWWGRAGSSISMMLLGLGVTLFDFESPPRDVPDILNEVFPDF